jgi:hypothetical protein
MAHATLAQFIAENRRCCILRTLSESTQYTANESLLHVVVGEFGFNASRDQIRGDITWLGEQGLLEIGMVENCMIPRITQRGLDVACGNVIVPGVKRPEPR